MTIRWTQPANDDFLRIIGWIAANNPVAALSVGQRILDPVERLLDHNRERAAACGRRLPLTPTLSPRAGRGNSGRPWRAPRPRV
jgi:plasmid stabilization system protein ParE